jgi:hypothetical protein
VSKLLYKPLGIVFGVIGGILAGKLFKKIWQWVAHEDEPPSATDKEQGWGHVLPAAALEGAVFAAVKAAVDRGGAEAFRKMTGVWPGD